MASKVEAWRALAYKGAALSSVISVPHSESSNVLISLNASEFPLLKSGRGPAGQAHHISRIQAEFGEPLTLDIIKANQVCQPMDASKTIRGPRSTGMPLPPQEWKPLPR